MRADTALAGAGAFVVDLDEVGRRRPVDLKQPRTDFWVGRDGVRDPRRDPDHVTRGERFDAIGEAKPDRAFEDQVDVLVL
jgi:hypothetical protein